MFLVKKLDRKQKKVKIRLDFEGEQIANEDFVGDCERLQLVLLKMCELTIEQSNVGSEVKVICRSLKSAGSIYMSVQFNWRLIKDGSAAVPSSA